MRIGPFHVLRVKKNPLGRPLHHWEEITLDQLSPTAQKLIAKMARASLRDYFEEEREAWQEARTTEIGARVAEQLAPVLKALQNPAPVTPAHPLVGDCMLCGQPMTAGVRIIDAGSSWAHSDAKDCRRPSARLDSVPEQKETSE